MQNSTQPNTKGAAAPIRLTAPFTGHAGRAALASLRAGDAVLLSGQIYSARDAAHKRLCALLENGEDLPLDISGAVFYYMGPTPAPPGFAIGAAGPTTSSRMDKYAPALLAQGLAGMVGKGPRAPKVLEAMQKHHAVYFAAVGGAGALISRAVKAAQPVCFTDLGPEAVSLLTVEDFPLTVAADMHGGNLYESGPAGYLAFMAGK